METQILLDGESQTKTIALLASASGITRSGKSRGVAVAALNFHNRLHRHFFPEPVRSPSAAPFLVLPALPHCSFLLLAFPSNIYCLRTCSFQVEEYSCTIDLAFQDHLLDDSGCSILAFRTEHSHVKLNQLHLQSHHTTRQSASRALI